MEVNDQDARRHQRKKNKEGFHIISTKNAAKSRHAQYSIGFLHTEKKPGQNLKQKQKGKKKPTNRSSQNLDHDKDNFKSPFVSKGKQLNQE